MLLDWLFQPRPVTKSKSRRPAPLCVELLETRACPSITLNAQVLPGHEVLLTGNVQIGNGGPLNGFGSSGLNLGGGLGTGSSPTVYFSGAVSGSVSLDALGNFVFLTNDASLGTVYAAVYNPVEQAPDIASALLAVNEPTMSLAVTGATANTVTLSGSVSGIDLLGQTITLSGAIQDSVVTDLNGNFQVTEPVTASGTVQINATDLWGQSSSPDFLTVQPVTAGAPDPQVTLDVLMLPGHQVQLSGVVTGSNAAGASVTLSGAASGSATADGNGFYSVTTTNATLGTVYAVGVDQAQEVTNTASAPISVPAPTLTLAITGATGDTVTFSGSLADLDVAGQTITINGASVNSVTTDANGNFSFTTSSSGLGYVSVSMVDGWGVASNTAGVDGGSLSIINFAAVQVVANEYSFQGDVVGANAAGATVAFGGLPCLVGQGTTAASDGSFSITQVVPSSQTGDVATAQASDSEGDQSNVAQCTL